MKNFILLFLLISFIPFSFSYDLVKETSYYWKIEKTGNEQYFDVNIATKEVVVSNIWTKILAFLGLKEGEYENWTVVEICSPNIKDKEVIREGDYFYVFNKEDSIKSIEEAEIKLYLVMPKTFEVDKLSESIPFTIKEDEKELKYCYYDLFNPEERDYIKYGENSIIITKVYNFTTEATLNQTQANSNFIHLEINNSASPYDALLGYWSFDGDTSTTVFDLSSNKNHGNYYNGAFSNASCDLGYGKCSSFDGVNDYTSFSGDFRTVLEFKKYDNTVPANSDTTSTNGRIPLGTSGKGDSYHVSTPSVIKDGDTYKMWYGGSDGTNWRIYYATSSDGLTWTKYDNS
ncbi:MAG: hypothetical protein NC935_02275, partial [Candidatus Omnitrophica bacterium]|nr:hypothetical protein [Candidatus Omnitrophota bacterium]